MSGASGASAARAAAALTACSIPMSVSGEAWGVEARGELGEMEQRRIMEAREELGEISTVSTTAISRPSLLTKAGLSSLSKVPGPHGGPPTIVADCAVTSEPPGE
eukprot:710258-Pyramimonas_sp.AAC.1